MAVVPDRRIAITEQLAKLKEQYEQIAITLCSVDIPKDCVNLEDSKYSENDFDEKIETDPLEMSGEAKIEDNIVESKEPNIAEGINNIMLSASIENDSKSPTSHEVEPKVMTLN